MNVAKEEQTNKPTNQLTDHPSNIFDTMHNCCSIGGQNIVSQNYREKNKETVYLQLTIIY